MSNHILITVFTSQANKMLEEGKNKDLTSKSIIAKYKQRVDSLMLSEFGLDYVQDLEYNDDIFYLFIEMDKLALQFAQKELQQIKQNSRVNSF